MKTAMMEHIQWLYEVIDISRAQNVNQEIIQAIEYVIKGAKAKLPMEKQQMNDMFCEGSKLIECPNELSARFEFAMYYNETYGGDK